MPCVYLPGPAPAVTVANIPLKSCFIFSLKFHHKYVQTHVQGQYMFTY